MLFGLFGARFACSKGEVYGVLTIKNYTYETEYIVRFFANRWNGYWLGFGVGIYPKDGKGDAWLGARLLERRVQQVVRPQRGNTGLRLRAKIVGR